MSQKYKVNFATFCHAGDAHRLHAAGQLKRQVESNKFDFERVIVVHQNCNPEDYEDPHFGSCEGIKSKIVRPGGYSTDETLRQFGIDITKPQYTSQTDNAHFWKNHVINHLKAIWHTEVWCNYIVFADNDCWMVRQPEHVSWVERGIEILQAMPDIFIVSPNDGEPERQTRRMSQQMFLARVDQFRYADFNQPNWDGNVNIPGGPMPEYWAMLEGRMELHCRVTGQYRYVLGPEYRYWHHNKLTEDDLFETDISKY